MTPLRRLVACGHCHRQWDAGKRPPGSRLRCSCGQTVVVPAGEGHDAAVVRCSSCGAPRGDGESCVFCGSGFTLHERDLHTLCPRCFGRVSDRARYCHGCGVAIVPEAAPGDATESSCPACGDAATLSSRRLGEEDLAVLECGRCAGLWLGAETFRRVEERAQAVSAGGAGGVVPRPSGLPPAPPGGALYRRCVVCAKMMNRQNYGRRSGVVVDVCAPHGTWFDARELDAILGWIRAGGLGHARRLEAERQRDEERLRRTAGDVAMPRHGDGGWLSGAGGADPWTALPGGPAGGPVGDLFAALAGFLRGVR